MQNPFVRLRKYRCDVIDPFVDENRTTETLAACLVFSEPFRQRFIEFLFDGKLPFDSINTAAVEVSTQRTTTKGQRVDLLLEQGNEWAVVVEAKVKDEERGQQIKEYREWLDETALDLDSGGQNQDGQDSAETMGKSLNGGNLSRALRHQ